MAAYRSECVCPTQANQIKVGFYIVVPGTTESTNNCQIIRVNEVSSLKTGKHGHAKTKISGDLVAVNNSGPVAASRNVFFALPAKNMVDVCNVTRREYLLSCWSFEDSHDEIMVRLSLLDPNTGKLKLSSESNLKLSLKGLMELLNLNLKSSSELDAFLGDNVVMVQVMGFMGEDSVIVGASVDSNEGSKNGVYSMF